MDTIERFQFVNLNFAGYAHLTLHEFLCGIQSHRYIQTQSKIANSVLIRFLEFVKENLTYKVT